MDLQPNPLSAMELIANEPIRLVHGRKAVCDGGKSVGSSKAAEPFDLWRKTSLIVVRGGISPFFLLLTLGIGPLGHPKIFINLVRTPFCPSGRGADLSIFLGQDKPGPQPCG
jgi:hypothetical protein